MNTLAFVNFLLVKLFPTLIRQYFPPSKFCAVRYVATPYSFNNNNNLKILSPLHVAVLNITNYKCVIWNCFQNLVTNIHGMLMSLNQNYVAKMLN